jgi:hypothetical protein
MGQQVRSGLVFETTGYHVVGGVSIAIKKSQQFSVNGLFIVKSV